MNTYSDYYIPCSEHSYNKTADCKECRAKYKEENAILRKRIKANKKTASKS
jgi:hypothetical protein